MIEVEGMTDSNKITKKYLQNYFFPSRDVQGLATIRRGVMLSDSAKSKMISYRRRMNASKNPELSPSKRKEIINMAKKDKIYADVMKRLGGKFTQTGIRINYDQFSKRTEVAKRAEAMLRAQTSKQTRDKEAKRIKDELAKRAAEEARLRKIVNWDSQTGQWVDGTGKIITQDEAIKILKGLE